MSALQVNVCKVMMMMLQDRFRSPLYITIDFMVIDVLKQCNIGTHGLFIYLRIKLINSFFTIFYLIWFIWTLEHLKEKGIPKTHIAE